MRVKFCEKSGNNPFHIGGVPFDPENCTSHFPFLPCWRMTTEFEKK